MKPQSTLRHSESLNIAQFQTDQTKGFPMRPEKQNYLILPALLLSAGMSHAAVVTYVGSQLNIDSTANDGATIGWHSTLNPKPLDIDGDNALGSDGWILAGNGSGGLSNPARFLPSYITSYAKDGGNTSTLIPNANTSFTSGVVDLPANGGLNLNPGTEGNGAAWHNTTANAVNLFVFTISNATLLLDETLRIGLLFDASAAAGSGTQVFTLTQTVGGSSTAFSPSLAHANDGLDVAFFDITGVATGDKFVINADSTTRTHLSGITFDSAIPEPGTALLGGLGLLMLLRRRR